MASPSSAAIRAISALTCSRYDWWMGAIIWHLCHGLPGDESGGLRGRHGSRGRARSEPGSGQGDNRLDQALPFAGDQDARIRLVAAFGECLGSGDVTHRPVGQDGDAGALLAKPRADLLAERDEELALDADVQSAARCRGH